MNIKYHVNTADKDTKAGIHSRGSDRSEYEPGSVITEK